MSAKWELPESLDQNLFDYIEHTAEEGQKEEAYKNVIESDKLTEEDRIIIADLLYDIAGESKDN